MKKLSRVLALLMCLAMIISVAVISAQAADEDVADVARLPAPLGFGFDEVADLFRDFLCVHS